MGMEVGIAVLRAQLKRWIEEAECGEEIIITERGVPVARLLGIDRKSTIERLTREGIISPPVEPERLRASGRPRAPTTRPVADIISSYRD